MDCWANMLSERLKNSGSQNDTQFQQRLDMKLRSHSGYGLQALRCELFKQLKRSTNHSKHLFLTCNIELFRGCTDTSPVPRSCKVSWNEKDLYSINKMLQLSYKSANRLLKANARSRNSAA